MSGQSSVEKPHELMTKAKMQRPSWEGDRLQALAKKKYIYLKRFLNTRNRTHHGVVAFESVDRFISSAGDVDVDWRSLLRICDKNNLAERYLWSSDYWTDSSRKDGISFVTLDDHLLISRGLYKTALARYALHYYGTDSLYGVKISQWSVDWEMYRIWLELRDICAKKYPHYRVKPNKKKISGYRAGHSVIDEYLLTLRVEDKRSGKVSRMGRMGAKNWLHELTADEETRRFSLENLKAYALAA